MLTGTIRAYEKEAKYLTEWFCELDTQLRGSGTLNVDMLEKCMEEMAFVLDVNIEDYPINVVRKGHPDAAVYNRPTKSH